MSRRAGCPGKLSRGIRQAPVNLKKARSARKRLHLLLSPNGLRGKPRVPLATARHEDLKGLADKQAAGAMGLRARQPKRLSPEDSLTAIIEGKILRALCLGPSCSEAADRLTGWLFEEPRKAPKGSQ